ncbi:MAG: hypothetical protein IPG00_12905 [Saprospiraceae bacterium]|nr:hypothetical protein [Saprospiraceae bacterium]
MEILGERNSYSKTDQDAVFMRLKDDHMQNGQLKQPITHKSVQDQFITLAYQTAGGTTTLETHLDGLNNNMVNKAKIIAEWMVGKSWMMGKDK